MFVQLSWPFIVQQAHPATPHGKVNVCTLVVYRGVPGKGTSAIVCRLTFNLASYREGSSPATSSPWWIVIIKIVHSDRGACHMMKLYRCRSQFIPGYINLYCRINWPGYSFTTESEIRTIAIFQLHTITVGPGMLGFPVCSFRGERQSARLWPLSFLEWEPWYSQTTSLPCRGLCSEPTTAAKTSPRKRDSA